MPFPENLMRSLIALNSQTAAMLERTVRNAVALAVQRTGNVTANDSMGYPLGYFETTEGCFADGTFDFPTDLRFESGETE